MTVRLCVGFLACATLLGCANNPNAAPSAAPADTARAKELFEKGLATQKAGNVPNAIGLFNQAIFADNRFVPALNHLAWLRATDKDETLRHAAEAVKLAERACEVAVDPKQPTVLAANCLDTLAAAYAEAGRYAKAVAVAQRAADAARAVGRNHAAVQFEQRKRLYEQRKPYHE